MVIYARYAAKLITSHKVFCNVNQVAFPAEVRTEKCKCSEQAYIRCSGLGISCVLVAFMVITILNPASLSPSSDVFHTILIICKASLLQNTNVFSVFHTEKLTALPFLNASKVRMKTNKCKDLKTK
jgi:hypothetical protein